LVDEIQLLKDTMKILEENMSTSVYEGVKKAIAK
jgi:hypothetical protein